MKAMCINEAKEFVWQDVPNPVCHDEFNVKIKIHACAINRADLMQRAGIYAPPEGWPKDWPGLECAGEVVECPAGGRFKIGDKVCALLGGGGYAEEVVVPEGMVMPMPRGFDYWEAAGIPEVYATAYLNLKIVGEIQKGETFFINGGEGGLGIATTQLAKHVFGCKVVAQVASDENGEFCKGVGADIVNNRFKDDLVKTLSENPPNVAIDPVGGPLMGKCIATMPYRGRWISLASMAGPETTLDVNLLWRKNLRVIGSTLRSRTSAEKAAILTGLVQDVWPAFEARKFVPFVHKVLPLTEAAEGHRILEAGENRGKVVLTMKKILVGLLLAFAAQTSLAAVEWPFAILRSYGSYEDNKEFLSRAFAAQERHPNLINEIWFDGVKNLFGNPDQMGAETAELNLAAKPLCEKLNIAFSYQQGVTLNHDPDDLPHPGIPDDAWVVDREGKRRSGVFCCTSPFALDFSYRKAKSILSAIHPESYWPDDDLRMVKVELHHPFFCFCPRCLKLLSERCGRTFTRETLLKELDGEGEGVVATRKMWCDFNAEMLNNYATTIQRAVNEVSPKTRLGIQVCLAPAMGNGNFNERVVKTYASMLGQAGVRPGGGCYSDLVEKTALISKMIGVARDAAQVNHLKQTGQICYEAENWPHIGSIKNPGGMMAECALAMAFGCNSIAFYWGADQDGESPESYDFYFETMHAWRPFHLAVREAFRGTQIGGFALYWGEGSWQSPNWYNRNDCCINRLARNALPVTVEESEPDIWVINSRIARFLAKADFATVFARPVLMDSAAFAILAKRFPDLKFTQKLKVASGTDERALSTSVRQNGYEKFARYGKAESVENLLYPQTEDVVRFSEMTLDPKACGTCIVPTEFGGKIVVAQDVDGVGVHLNWPGCRRHAILDALDAATPGGMPVRLLTDGYAVLPVVRKASDGKTTGIFLLNLGSGETPPLELAIRQDARTKWSVLLPKKDKIPAKVRQTSKEIILTVPSLAACEPMLITAE